MKAKDLIAILERNPEQEVYVIMREQPYAGAKVTNHIYDVTDVIIQEVNKREVLVIKPEYVGEV